MPRFAFDLELPDGSTRYAIGFSNDGGVRVDPDPFFSPPQNVQNEFRTILSDLISGETYIIQKSADLRSWLPIQTNTASGPTMAITNVIDPGVEAWFLRAVR